MRKVDYELGAGGKGYRSIIGKSYPLDPEEQASDEVSSSVGQQAVIEMYEGVSTESLKFQAPPSRDSRDNTSVSSNYQYRGK